MKVFLSWSGNRSQQVAEFLSSWIRQVLQASETWISTDIEKGTRWNEKISEKLEQTKVGIICLTKENLNSNWLLFESGALSKTKDAIVGTFLLDVKPSDVEPPLSQFQHTLFEKEDIRKLIQTINNKIIECKEKTLEDKDLNAVFEIFYPTLEARLVEIKDKSIVKKSPRTDRDILEEVLSSIRELKFSNVSLAATGSSGDYFFINSSDQSKQYSRLVRTEDGSYEIVPRIRTKFAHGLSNIDEDDTIKIINSPRMGQFIGRNDLCPCGSGKKFKFCHGSENKIEPDLSEVPEE